MNGPTSSHTRFYQPALSLSFSNALQDGTIRAFILWCATMERRLQQQRAQQAAIISLVPPPDETLPRKKTHRVRYEQD